MSESVNEFFENKKGPQVLPHRPVEEYSDPEGRGRYRFKILPDTRGIDVIATLKYLSSTNKDYLRNLRGMLIATDALKDLEVEVPEPKKDPDQGFSFMRIMILEDESASTLQEGLREAYKDHIPPDDLERHIEGIMENILLRQIEKVRGSKKINTSGFVVTNNSEFNDTDDEIKKELERLNEKYGDENKQ